MAGHYNDSTAVPLVTLHEPAKALAWGWPPGQPIPRAGQIVLKQQARTYEAVVDLAGRRLVSHREVPGVQPNWLDRLIFEVPDIERFQSFVSSDEVARAMEEDKLKVATVRVLGEFTP